MAFKKFTNSSTQLKPDTRFNNIVVSKFINTMMYQGKKSTATRSFYDAMEIVGKKLKDQSPVEVFEQALNNCKPSVEVRSKRVGGSNYQVPMPVNRKRQQSLAMRWIRDAARGKKGRPFAEALAQELMDAFKNEGTRHNDHQAVQAPHR